MDGTAEDRARQLRGRRRRRRVAAAVGIVAVAALAAGLVGVSGVGSPAHAPSGRALAAVAGVDVTWLPDGYRPNDDVATMTGLDLGRSGMGATYLGRPASQARARPALGLTVERGPVEDLDALARLHPAQAAWTTVRGHRALLLTWPDDVTGTTAYTLDWVERNSLTVEVAADTYASPAQARRFAAGLVVRDRP